MSTQRVKTQMLVLCKNYIALVIPHQLYSSAWDRVFSCFCLYVHALKGKWLEVSRLNWVHLYPMDDRNSVCTDPEIKRSKVKVKLFLHCLHFALWCCQHRSCMLIGLPMILVCTCCVCLTVTVHQSHRRHQTEILAMKHQKSGESQCDANELLTCML